MSDSKILSAGAGPNSRQKLPPALGSARLVLLPAAVLVLVLCYLPWFKEWWRLAMRNELYSHLPIIPFVSLYLVWIARSGLPGASRPAWGWVVVGVCSGVLLLLGNPPAEAIIGKGSVSVHLALGLLSWYGFFMALCAGVLGQPLLTRLAFPLFFLVFLVPIPTLLMSRIEHGLQYASADATVAMLRLVGTPVKLVDLDLNLPNGIVGTVAPECSGIHSTLVLFIISLVAGHLFLRSAWRRAALTIFVIPLAIVRNGFRIFTISELCVHYGPQMMDHWIHRRGGPVFFALSLAPFLVFLVALQRWEKNGRPVAPKCDVH